MDNGAYSTTQKPATAARMYDYYLGGIHNFPADQAAAKELVSRYPFVPALARSNRAFVGRAVRFLTGAGVRQFFDVGSGIPTVGNVHEIAQDGAPDSRVVYVDLDPVAVAEGQEILEGNANAIAIRGDIRSPQPLLDHPEIRRLLDFGAPVAVLLAAVLHFIPDDAEAYGAVERFVAALAPGSYLVVSHTATETFLPDGQMPVDREDIYRSRTSTPGTVRTQAEVSRFFTGLDLVDPGVVQVAHWRPDPAAGSPDDSAPAEWPDGPPGGGLWVGVARKP
jgi:SAM-dependent methyltransferase